MYVIVYNGNPRITSRCCLTVSLAARAHRQQSSVVSQMKDKKSELYNMPKLFGAKWWEVIGAIGVIIGLLVTLNSIYFSEVPAVLPEDPEYPKISAYSQCEGQWIATEYRLCEDKDNPIYEMVTDANICGVEKTTELKNAGQFKTCEHPSHGIVGYKKTKIFEVWSGWRKGGYDQRSWCNELQSRAAKSIGQPIEWEVIETKEQRKEEFLRRFFYKYYCKAEAQWEPIYRTAQSKACGIEQPVAVNIEIAKTCQNPDVQVEYKRTRRKECNPTVSRKFYENGDASKLIEQIDKGEISWHKCATCEDLIENPNQYTECLIASAYYYMESSNIDGMKTIKSKLVARKSNPKGLNKKTEKRVKHQLTHLKEAL